MLDIFVLLNILDLRRHIRLPPIHRKLSTASARVSKMSKTLFSLVSSMILETSGLKPQSRSSILHRGNRWQDIAAASSRRFEKAAEGSSPSGVSGDAASETYGIAIGNSVSGTNSFTLTADSAGVDGNATQVVIKNDLREGVFTMEVYNDSNQMEAWGNLGIELDYYSKFSIPRTELLGDSQTAPAGLKPGVY